MSSFTYPMLLTTQTGPLLQAVAAHLARYKGTTRAHADSDLRIWFQWCTDHDLNPLQAERVHIERSCAGCRKCAGSNRPQSPAACQWSRASTAPA